MEITRSAQAKTEMLSLQIDQMLNMEKDNAAQMASGITSEDIINKSPALQAQMDRMSKNHKELGVLTAGAEDGSWMKSPDPGNQIYDPRERTWYKMALSQSEPVISDTFQSATTGEWSGDSGGQASRRTRCFWSQCKLESFEGDSGSDPYR